MAFALDPTTQGADFTPAVAGFFDQVWRDRRLVELLRSSGHGPSQTAAIEALAARIAGFDPRREADDAYLLRARFAAAGIVELMGLWLATADPDAARATYADALYSLVHAVMTAP